MTERRDHGVRHHGAKLRAMPIAENDYDRFFAEIAGESNGLACIIGEHEIERKLVADFLFKPDGARLG